MTIVDNGPGIPDHELAVLDEGEETPLQHGSGLGLWLVYWLVDKSNGSLEFETGEDGTSVTCLLPAADPPERE
ncbi:MAG: ATP-binding protein [Natrialbaceae archaeon]|nr:ATP-binding protein [Natrialbaceae archaeon]